MLEQIIIPVISAVVGFAVGNWEKILGWKRRVQKEEHEIGEQLMKAINEGRKEILESYEIIDKMEAENRTLKRANIELTVERDTFRTLAEQLKAKLEKVTQDFDDCAEQARRYLSKPKDEADKN